MALPTSRNRTYVDGTPVHPGDLNDVQDCVIGQKFPKHWRWYSFPVATGPVVGGTNISYSSAGGITRGCIRATNVSNRYDAPLNLGLPPGTRIDGAKLSVSGAAGGGNIQLSFLIYNAANVSNEIHIFNDANPGAGVTTTFTDDPIDEPYVLADGDHLMLLAVMPAVDVTFNKFALHVSRL